MSRKGTLMYITLTKSQVQALYARHAAATTLYTVVLGNVTSIVRGSTTENWQSFSVSGGMTEAELLAIVSDAIKISDISL